MTTPIPSVANPAGFQFSRIDYQVENILLPLQRRLAARGERLFINLCYVDFRRRARPATSPMHEIRTNMPS